MPINIKLSPKYGLNPTIPSCFWCGKLKSEIALFGKIGKDKEDIKAQIGAFLDYEPCDDCKTNRLKGVTLMEVSKSPMFSNQPEIKNGIFPTGKWCVIRQEAAEKMFSGFLNDKNALFIDEEIYNAVVEGNRHEERRMRDS